MQCNDDANDAAVTGVAAIADVTAQQDKHFMFKASVLKSISNNMQAAKKLAAAAGNIIWHYMLAPSLLAPVQCWKKPFQFQDGKKNVPLPALDRCHMGTNISFISFIYHTEQAFISYHTLVVLISHSTNHLVQNEADDRTELMPDVH